MKPSGMKIIAGIVLACFAVRGYRLTAFPIFTDEAIYIHWAQIIAGDPGQLFIPLVDGKQPLFMWLTALFLPLISDPLVAGRTVSIAAGLFALAGIYLIGRDHFSARHGLAAALVHAFCPYAFFFDRLALVDSLLSALGVWTVYVALGIATGRRSGPVPFAVMGTFLGLAALTKASALALAPVPLFVFLVHASWRREGFWKGILLCGTSAGLFVLPLFISGQEVGQEGRIPFLHRADYFLSPQTLLTFPWSIWGGNLRAAGEFLLAYLTLPLIAVLFFAAVLAVVEREKNLAVMAFWALFPLATIMAVANGFFSRYFLVSVPPLTLLASAAIVRLAEFSSGLLKRFFSRVREGMVLTVFALVTISHGFFLPGNWRATR
ncbi:MAG: glycosyltransferase family 39 protein [Nitrospinae bacterium]|nr:glycosyltransferase family 39 protein [Nitrospinota bacterium]